MRFLTILFSVIVTGCQAMSTHQQPHGMDQAAFASIWSLYEQCQAGQDPESLRTHAAQLARAVPVTEEWYAKLPMLFDRSASKQPLRVAADPKAMAASCTLRAARVVFEASHQSVAESLYRSVLVGYPETEYAYYTEQAQRGLRAIEETALHVPVARPVSTR